MLLRFHKFSTRLLTARGPQLSICSTNSSDQNILKWELENTSRLFLMETQVKTNKYVYNLVTDRTFGSVELLLWGLAQMTELSSAEHRTFFSYYRDSPVSAVFWSPANRTIGKTPLIRDWFRTISIFGFSKSPCLQNFKFWKKYI